MDAAEVESGELRWPPDEPSSPDAQTERKRADEQTAGEEEREVTERLFIWCEATMESLTLFIFCYLGHLDLN